MGKKKISTAALNQNHIIFVIQITTLNISFDIGDKVHRS